MNRIKLAVVGALVGVSTAALALDAASEATREQRMNNALQDYRDRADHDASSGPVARTEESTKRGLRKAGAAVEHGAKRAGHAVGTGVNKAGAAIHRSGEKIQGSTTSTQ